MITRVISATGITTRGPTLEDADFELSYIPVISEVSGGSAVDSVTLDRNIRTTTGATVLTEAIITPNQLVFGTFSRGLTITPLNSGIATVELDENGDQGIVTRVSNGDARFLVNTPLLIRDITIPVSLSGGASAVEFLSYTTGSLSKHSSDALDTKIAASQEQNLFTSYNHGAGTYTLNGDVWPDVDLSPYMVWNSHTNGPQGVAVTPLHVISPEHYPIPDGSTVRFIGNDGSVNSRTISSHTSIGGTDIRVSRLSSALPGTVNPAKVLPATYEDFLPSIKILANGRITYPVPGFYINQFYNAIVIEVGLGTNVTYGLSPISTSEPERHALYTFAISGDSGSPVFLIINGEVVVLTTLQYPISGPSIHDYITEINAAITSLGGGGSLTTINLSSFTDFS